MQLYCGEQSQEQVLKLFDELDELTREPFHKAKAEIDAALAKNYGITVAELRPWHYHDPFFQEVPAVLGELPESVYKPLDTVKVCREFYDGIGLPIDDVLKRSDLYEKPGKNPHAFSIDIDRAGDVRILENIVPGREWLGTTLHELGHAVVLARTCRRSLPYVLHTDAHPLCTEGVAMMFERFAQNVDWLQAMGAKVPDPEQFRAAAAKLRRNRLLVFSRYCQVMFRFEMATVRQSRPGLEPAVVGPGREVSGDQAARGTQRARLSPASTISSAPRPTTTTTCWARCSPRRCITRWCGRCCRATNPAGAIYVGNKAAGEFMQQRVFAPGLTLNWNELTRHATGEPLNPKAFAEDLTHCRN